MRKKGVSERRGVVASRKSTNLLHCGSTGRRLRASVPHPTQRRPAAHLPEKATKQRLCDQRAARQEEAAASFRRTELCAEALALSLASCSASVASREGRVAGTEAIGGAKVEMPDGDKAERNVSNEIGWQQTKLTDIPAKPVSSDAGVGAGLANGTCDRRKAVICAQSRCQRTLC